MLSGNHLVAGQWLAGSGEFQSSPATGEAHSFTNGTMDLVDQAAQAAEQAFESYAGGAREDRAEFLRQIAAELEKRGDAIKAIAGEESGLPAMRLAGELGRTTGQLRLFADHVAAGDYLDRHHTTALPDREPLPRPELRLMMRAIGPVVVFGASNFPLAFSTAGGDTASALAAGCPVIVKGHPAHPGTGELVAQAIQAAIETCGMHPGVFSFIQDSGYDVARALVQHPLVKAVGFTGSLKAGRALFDLCAARPEPIPFFGELGSINPGFVMPAALANRGVDIATAWAGSLTMGAGQFCTNPGVLFVAEGAAADTFIASAAAALGDVGTQTMLTDGIADACRAGVTGLENIDGVAKLAGEVSAGRTAGPYLFEVSAATWRANASLAEEVFGPVGIVVRAPAEEFAELARSLDGQLTATLHMDEGDHVAAAALLPILERKAGRLLANGFPTGVEVDAGMMHGGPYPASTNAATTSVGTLAIRRFLRPVCYQGMPADLLPADLGN